MDKNSCAEDFPFFYIADPARKLFNKEISGVAGLARARPFALAPEQEVDVKKLIVEAVTDKNVFTFSFKSNNFAVFDPAKTDITTEVPEVKVNNDFFWST